MQAPMASRPSAVEFVRGLAAAHRLLDQALHEAMAEAIRGGESVAEVAAAAGVHRSTLYRHRRGQAEAVYLDADSLPESGSSRKNSGGIDPIRKPKSPVRF